MTEIPILKMTTVITNAQGYTLELSVGTGLPSIDGKSSIIALGTFDGVHVAHRELIKNACTLKDKLGADTVGVFCFEESPAAILKGISPTSLTSKTERIELILSAGADFVVMGRFEELCGIEATDFINDILISRLGSIGTVCGYNHRFGHRGLGDPALLESVFGIENTVTVPMISISGQAVSSSAIRDHIRNGNIEIANRMLGRCFSFTATINEGKGLGRKLGFPTANQVLPRYLAPLKMGVYATRCTIDGEQYFGVTNVGVRPSITFGDDHQINCEAHIIGLSRYVYGESMKTEFCAFLRDEKKFSSLDDLTLAIERDRDRTLEYFNSTDKNND